MPAAGQSAHADGGLPPPVHVHARLRDGNEVILQPLRPQDRERLLDAYDQLSPHSRRMRFLHPMGRMPEALLQRLLSVDAERHFAWAALDQDGKGLGIARYIRGDDPEGRAAEMALTVLDQAQGHGLGSLLLGLIMRSATAHGIDRFTGLVLAENRPMRHLIADLGGRFDFTGSDALSFEMPLPARAADLPDTPTGRVAASLYRAFPHWPPADGSRIAVPQF